MFATRITIAASIVLIALACAAQGITDRKAPNDKEPAEKVDPMFPDGVVHDFGKVKMGTEVKWTFRVVNTSNVPLKIKSLRFHSCSRGFAGRSTKDLLQPNEAGTIEMAVDTKVFIGEKANVLVVTMECGEITETRFWVRAISVGDPPGK